MRSLPLCDAGRSTQVQESRKPQISSELEDNDGGMSPVQQLLDNS